MWKACIPSMLLIGTGFLVSRTQSISKRNL
jgi:hypothetical protein